jgi:tetratricopeptide (TPR) repeat protein
MQSNRYVLIAIILGIVLVSTSYLYINRSSIDNQDKDDIDTQTPGLTLETEPEQKPELIPVNLQSTVETLVQDYLSALNTQVHQEEKEYIETTVKDYPIKNLPSSEAVTVLASEDEEIDYTVDIKTRDWAYAALGVENTLIGGLVDGQEEKLELGLYSFLQAVALNLNEPEHLSNVAFHLNNNGEYIQAESFLQYALTLDESYFPAISNLAYAYAGQGNYTEAILQQVKVVSLRPEKFYLLRLADLYMKAGLHEASEAVTNAIEGSEIVVTPPSPHILTLSPDGESVMDEIDILDERLYAKLEALIESKRLPLYDLMEVLFNDWADLLAKALFECPMEVASSGGDAQDICVRCYIPAAEEAFSLISSFRGAVVPAIHSFESEAFIELEKHTREAVETVNVADLEESDREEILKEIHRRFTIEYTLLIMGSRQRLSSTWTQIQAEYEAAFAEGCGDVSVDIPEFEEVNYECEILPALCKKWNFWLVVGSIGYDPNTREFDFSIGQGLAFKYKYNFARDVSNVGVGYGINLDKVVQAGATIYFNPTDGVQGELSAEFTPPIPMLVFDAPTGVKTSKPLFGSLMN